MLPLARGTPGQLNIVRTAGLLAGYTVLHIGGYNRNGSFLLQSPILTELPYAYQSELNAWRSRLSWIEDIGCAMEFSYDHLLPFGELTVVTTASHISASCTMI